MGIDIREAISAADRLAVYRFRYDVYVTEMNRVQEYADHRSRTIKEPLDPKGSILAAFEDGSVIGTVRVNYAGRGTAAYYPELYGMHHFGPYFPDHICFTTKLMVGPQHRSSTLGLRLCKFACVKAVRDGMRFDFMDCNTHLVPFFQRMGYRQVIPNIVHREYGEVHPMMCALHDLSYLRSVGSAFAGVVAAVQGSLDAESVRFLYDDILPKRLESPGLSDAQRNHLFQSLNVHVEDVASAAAASRPRVRVGTHPGPQFA